MLWQTHREKRPRPQYSNPSSEHEGDENIMTDFYTDSLGNTGTKPPSPPNGGYLRDALNNMKAGAEKIGNAVRPGLPSGVPLQVPPDTGIMRSVANGARATGSALASGVGVALRAAPGINGFLDGSGVMRSPSSAATGTGNQPGTDIPTDISPERKAQMMAPSTYTPPDPDSPLVGYMKRSRDGILSSIHNASIDGVRQSLNALPGTGAIGLIGGLAQGGSRLAKVGAIGAETMLADRAGFGIGKGLVDTGFIQTPPASPPGPATKTSGAAKRVENIAQKNPGLFNGLAGVTGDTTSAPGIVKLTGGQFKSPMFTDDPVRAAAQYASKKDSMFSVVPSTADADRSYLAGAFAQHINSGDLDRAAATAVTPQDRAALGIAYNQRQKAQAQAAQEDPIRRMLMESANKLAESANKSPREQRLSVDVRTRAFSGVSGPRGAQPAAGGGQGDIQAMLQQMAQKGGQPQQSAIAQAMAQTSAQQALQQTQQASAMDNALKGQQLNSGKLMETLRMAAMNETDPTKRASAIEALLAAQGKSTKDNPNRIIKLTVPHGEPNKIDGKQGSREVLYDMDAGKIIDPAEHIKAAPPSREQIVTEAKEALTKGATKDAINAHSMKLFGFAPL